MPYWDHIERKHLHLPAGVCVFRSYSISLRTALKTANFVQHMDYADNE